MTRIAALLIALPFLGCASVHPKAETPPAAETPADVTAAADELVEVVLTEPRFDEMMKGVSAQFLAPVIAKVRDSKLPQDIQADFEAALREPFITYAEMKKMCVDVYAQHFTAAELKEITAFYRTKVGTRVLTELPQLMTQSMQQGAKLGQERAAQRMQKVLDKIRQRTGAVPAAAH